MLSDWYKKHRARRDAPLFFRGAVLLPVVGAAAVLIARYLLLFSNGFLSDDQLNFMVATLLMIAVPSFVLAGYCAAKLTQLARETGLTLFGLLETARDDER